MRLLLFHSQADSLNHFIDELAFQFKNMVHEVCIVDVTALDAEVMLEFCRNGRVVAICYDGFCALDKELCEQFDITLVNIMMDHPMSFVDSMVNPPKKYIQVMPDRNHVEYAKHYYNIEHAYFMPHMGSLNVEFGEELEPYEKEITIWFPAGYRSPNSLLQDINERFASGNTNVLALSILEYLLANTDKTVEAATIQCAKDLGINIDDVLIAKFLSHAKLIDHFVRMYHREKVVRTIVAAGLSILLTGDGWKQVLGDKRGNVSYVPYMSFVDVFSFMEHSQITLNVMPWFKDGTHDRIFNALLHNSCPLTDESNWFVQNMEPDKECFYYSLKELDKLPDKIQWILDNPQEQKKLITNGREKVLERYTTKQVAEQIINLVNRCFN